MDIKNESEDSSLSPKCQFSSDYELSDEPVEQTNTR